LLSSRFLPHTYCYLNDKKLIALHFGSDLVIWLSYVSIALTLGYLVRRTRRTGVAHEPLQDCLELIDRCSKEIRTMSHLLHPPLLEEMGLASAIPWYASGFQERSGIEVQLDMPPDFDRLESSVEVVLFRVLQESLTNIHRHSGSKRAHIRLQIHSGQAILTIQDQGKGFDAYAGRFASGVGIAGMRERVREVGGELKINSKSGGTMVEAVVPLQRTAVECL
jgi:signal transduction histidine kinase